MSAPLRFESFVSGDPPTAAFESLRAAIYTAPPPEPLLAGTECLLAFRDQRPVARASLWLVDDLHGAPGLSGLIGHYESLDRFGPDLLGEACRRLEASAVARGGRLARILGPMNGNTWARYRLALPSEAGDRSFEPQVFLTEPMNPMSYPDDFAAANFTVVTRYLSRIDLDPGRPADDAGTITERLAARGIRVRTLDLARFDDELHALHALSLEAFADNPFYTPLSFAPFRAMYEAIRPLIDPELVLFAEDEAGLVGFMFGFFDPLSPALGGPPRAVAKTIAVAKRARGLALGHHLMDELRRRSHERGAREVIHALMHETNASTRMSARHETHVFRRYALFESAR
jgi:ribosomal protein S18 acetylase RimI-like enzyme